MGNTDLDVSFEDLVQNEHTQKEKALMRISQAKRERSGSNLEKILERMPKSERIKFKPEDDGDDDDDSEDGDENDPDNDLRKALFESIPEPYPHTTNFQRVVISEAGDPIDQDTKDACAKLKKCMDIRAKWIGAHPFPPQDCESNFPVEPPSPDRPVARKGKIEGSYRRRMPPTYEIFGVELPPTVNNLRFKMVDGVVRVQTVAAPTTAIDRNSNLTVLAKPNEELNDDEGIDWSTSIYPVWTYKDYVEDYTHVCII